LQTLDHNVKIQIVRVFDEIKKKLSHSPPINFIHDTQDMINQVMQNPSNVLDILSTYSSDHALPIALGGATLAGAGLIAGLYRRKK